MSAFKTGPVVGDMGSFGSTPGVLEFDVHLVGLFSRQLQPCESGERGRIWGFEGCTRIDYAPPPLGAQGCWARAGSRYAICSIPYNDQCVLWLCVSTCRTTISLCGLFIII